MTAADHTNTVRDDLDTLDEYLHVGVPLGADHMLSVRSRAILAMERLRTSMDALAAQAETAEEWNPLYGRLLIEKRKVEAERDAAVQAVEQHRAALADEMGLTEQQRARAEAAEQAAEQAEGWRDAFLAEQQLAEQARNALRQIASGNLQNIPGVNPDGSVSSSSMAECIARAALAGNQP